MINHTKKDTNFDTFHFVKGNKMFGILIDPGAAKGLIGSDTLSELINNVLKPAKMDKYIKRRTSNNKFTGISADPQQSLGMVTFPIGLKGCKYCEFSCDVIGGTSSKCPALMPLSSMLSAGCLISCGFFANGDGLFGIRGHDGKFCTQRLLFTDSGHYLLPIHHFNTPADEKLNRLMKDDFNKLKKDHDKTTHKHKHTEHQHHKAPKGHLTFPVALHTDDGDDEIAPPPGLDQSPLFH